ncbi:hypothetical protein F0L68_39410 [Solihabitans fulvus]|uniref:Uncharacterized protein n=1 Tax=Solihabitans fulvus TaxID=1892852 RepID=A0A5B2WA63_9PSEU|nr:hypothetical protein [Solihabitans fulvus]KAA2248893.1 hypothetical protein F0L68_39410 [Solihabitans fulvus]
MMWEEDEQKLLAELRSAVGGPAPSASPNLGEVVRLGRRRRAARRAAAAAGALALVVGVGVGATLLRGAAQGSADQAGAASSGWAITTAPAVPGWTKVNLPPKTPYGTWQPDTSSTMSPGRPVLKTPMCSLPVYDTRDWFGSVEPTEQFRAAFEAALRTAAAPAQVGSLAARRLEPDPTKGQTQPAHDYQADVTDHDGTGSIRLTASHFQGTPTEAADHQAFDKGNCAAPGRQVLPDGTVLQLYDVRPSSPFQSLNQAMRIYTPKGLVYELELANYGSPDFRANPRQPEIPDRVGAGRGTLPLSESQLTQLGLAVAAAG